MTRSELIQRLASRFPQLTRVDAELAVLAILDKVSEQLAQGGRVEIRGFGVFSVHVRPPRRGRNPKTGERVDVPAKAVPHFKPGTELRERVDRG
jgi:integration host factor subunit beta